MNLLPNDPARTGLPEGLRIFRTDGPFALESGDVLPSLQIGYNTFGRLNQRKDNVVWVCHALTANSNPVDWWPGFVGPGCTINPEKHFIVCANMLGSCYGSTGPASPLPERRIPYYHDFPPVTIRDLVRAHTLLRQHLGIEQIRLLIGGSMGGQQVLEWAVHEPEVVQQIAAIATNAQHSPWGIAFNAAQRMAIEADPSYYHRSLTGGQNGLAAARAIAMLSYRSYTAYERTQTDDRSRKFRDFRAESYQRYQGDKLVHRFSPHSYVTLSRAMDSHDLGRSRGPVEEVLQSIRARALLIGVTTDELFPVTEQRFLSQHIPNAIYAEVDSSYGHDGFLIETEQLSYILESHLAIKTDQPVEAAS